MGQLNLACGCSQTKMLLHPILPNHTRPDHGWCATQYSTGLRLSKKSLCLVACRYDSIEILETFSEQKTISDLLNQNVKTFVDGFAVKWLSFARLMQTAFCLASSNASFMPMAMLTVSAGSLTGCQDTLRTRLHTTGPCIRRIMGHLRVSPAMYPSLAASGMCSLRM